MDPWSLAAIPGSNLIDHRNVKAQSRLQSRCSDLVDNYDTTLENGLGFPGRPTSVRKVLMRQRALDSLLAISTHSYPSSK